MTVNSPQITKRQTMAEAFIHSNSPKIEQLLGPRPDCQEAWTARAAWLDGKQAARAVPAELAEALLRYNKQFAITPPIAANIEALATGALAVVGGQQAGLWGGPLLSLHKAVTIIQAARQAEALLQRPVVPVFWIAGEDHDWDEASQAVLLAPGNRLRKLSVRRPAQMRSAVSRTTLAAEEWESVLAEAEAILPDTEHKAALLARLRSNSAAAATLSGQFALLLHQLLGDEGLVLLDADDPQLRQLEAPMFERLVANNHLLSEAYAATAQQVEELGYTIQADVVPDSANLFLYRHSAAANERILLHRSGEAFVDRKGSFSMPAAELLQLARQTPERLSNNVLTRPLMQDYVLPVLGTVLGPGEIGYWALTRGAFAALGMEMPLIVPRMSFTLVDRTVQKQMDRFGLDYAMVNAGLEQLQQAWLSRQDELQLEQRFAEAEAAILAAYRPLGEQVAEALPAIRELVGANQRKIAAEVHYMKQRALKALEQRHEAELQQWRHIDAMLRPGGQPQERVHNISAFCNLYGNEWVKRVLAAPYNSMGGHQLIEL